MMSLTSSGWCLKISQTVSPNLTDSLFSDSAISQRAVSQMFFRLSLISSGLSGSGGSFGFFAWLIMYSWISSGDAIAPAVDPNFLRASSDASKSARFMQSTAASIWARSRSLRGVCSMWNMYMPSMAPSAKGISCASFPIGREKPSGSLPSTRLEFIMLYKEFGLLVMIPSFKN